MTQTSNITEHILTCLKESAAKKVLDVGCGQGSLSKALNEFGFQVMGIEPNPESIKNATQNAPDVKFCVAGAEDIPAPDNAFDAVILLNSFHHIPREEMFNALGEFKRILDANGELIIIEPLTRGSFFEAMKPVEDETEIRQLALSTLQDVVDKKMWELRSQIQLDRISQFSSSDEFIERLVSVDPARREAAKIHKDLIHKLFSQYAHKEGEKYSLIQPHTIWRMKAL